MRIGIEIGVKLVASLALGRSGRARPVGFEQWTGDVGDLKLVVLKNLARIIDLFRRQIGDVLVPHGTQLNPAKLEVVGSNLACLLEILGDLVIDHGQPEWAV